MMISTINAWKVNMKEKLKITSNRIEKQKEKYQKKAM